MAPLAPAEVGAVAGVGHAAAAAVGGHDVVERDGDADDQAGEGRHVVEGDGSATTPTWASGSVYRRAPASAVDVVNGEDAGHGLLLQPLLGVAGGDTGGVGELGDGAGAAEQGVVQAQAVAQVDAEQLKGADGGVEHPLVERGHGCVPSRGHVVRQSGVPQSPPRVGGLDDGCNDVRPVRVRRLAAAPRR